MKKWIIAFLLISVSTSYASSIHRVVTDFIQGPTTINSGTSNGTLILESTDSISQVIMRDDTNAIRLSNNAGGVELRVDVDGTATDPLVINVAAPTDSIIVEADGDVGMTAGTSAGFILMSPDASCSKCTVNNSDVLSCATATCP